MTTINLQVAADNCDGWCYTDGTGGALYSSPVYLGKSTKSLRGLFRFVNNSGVSITTGAIISSAVLSLKCETSSTDVTSLKAYCEDADNPGAFSGTAEMAARVKTTAAIDWDISSWTSGTWYTLDIASAVQEVVTSYGWANNGAIVIIVEDDGSASWRRQYAYDYNSSSANAAKLDVTYTLPAAAIIDPRRRAFAGIIAR